MGYDGILPSDKRVGQQHASPDGLATTLSLEANQIGPKCGKHPAGKVPANERDVDRLRDPGIWLVRNEHFQPEAAMLADKKLERKTLLDDQLDKLYPYAKDADTVKRLRNAFDNSYDTIAQALDGFENSARFRACQSDATQKDLSTRRELMEWVNRADQEGRDNNLPRLTRDQQATLDALEKIRAPEAGATPQVKSDVETLRQMEIQVAKAHANVKGARTRVDSHRRGDLTKNAAVKPYILKPDDQPNVLSPDVIDGILNKGEPHHVTHASQRLAEVNQICHNLEFDKNRRKEYLIAKAEQGALNEVRNPRDLNDALRQEYGRGLIIAQELVGLTPQGACSLRRFRDHNDTDPPKPFDGKTLSIITGGVHQVDGHIEGGVHHINSHIGDRLKWLDSECRAREGKTLPSEDHNYWVMIAERNALHKFRDTTPEHERARALRIKQELLGLSPGETEGLNNLRYPKPR